MPIPSSSRTPAPADDIHTERKQRRKGKLSTPAPSKYEDLHESICRSMIEDALEMLRKFDTIIIVDDSGSMYGERWREARDVLASLVQTASIYDIDGIDIYFLNDRQYGTNMKSDAAVKRLFDSVRPLGITPIGTKLEELLSQYLSLLDGAKDSGNPFLIQAIKPVNYIIITDGAPSTFFFIYIEKKHFNRIKLTRNDTADDPEEVIINAARRLDARNYSLSQVGIQFVQIGNSKDATDYLEELDNCLASKKGIRDIVDTTRYDGQLSPERLIKALLGGINRRVDKKGVVISGQ
jgi:hypothetical protein